jgi:hypothetical protein
MVLFFVFTLRYGGSTAPYKKVFTNAGGDVGIGRTLLSAHILEYTCQILHTCPAILPTLAAICTILLMLYQSIGFFYKNQRFCLTKR